MQKLLLNSDTTGKNRGIATLRKIFYQFCLIKSSQMRERQYDLLLLF